MAHVQAVNIMEKTRHWEADLDASSEADGTEARDCGFVPDLETSTQLLSAEQHGPNREATRINLRLCAFFCVYVGNMHPQALQ